MKKVRCIDLHKGRHLNLPESRTILDIDGVLADFTKSFFQRASDLGLKDIFPSGDEEYVYLNCGVPKKHFKIVWDSVKDDEDFWLNIEVIPGTLESLTFKPFAYITHRPIANEISIAWLHKNKFPNSQECHTVSDPKHKVKLALKLGAKRIIDDLPNTCKDFIDAGLDAFLFDRPHNLRIEDIKRIYELSEIE